MKLTDASLFRHLEPNVAEAIARVFRRAPVEMDQVVFRQGERGDAVVLVTDGLFELVQHGAQGDIHLADVQPGRILGLASLIDPGPRTATLRALDDGEVAVLDRATFRKLWEADGDAAAKLHLQMALIAVDELRSGHRKLLEELAQPLPSTDPRIDAKIRDAATRASPRVS